MNRNRLTAVMVAGALLLAAQAFPQKGKGAGYGRAVVTIFAKHSEVAPNVSQKDVGIKVNGKDSGVTGWAQFKGADDALELVVLIDSGARNLGRQFEEITQFLQSLGPHTKIAVGYMENGRAVMAGPLSADHKQVVGELHLPTGPSTNPYFSLSDLARNWPSQNGSSQNSQAQKVRREVILLSDGVDPNNPRFDPDDPYVQSAIQDSVRAGLVIYTIYWRSRPDGGDNSMTANGGQSLMDEVTQATGGNSYWSGAGNPVSFQPFFEDLMRRFANQYALEFAAAIDRKPAIETLKLKVEGLGLQVTSPQQVFVDRTPAS